jgi:hypothetical protein
MAGVGELTLQLRITSIPGVPEGWVPIRFGIPQSGEWFLCPMTGKPIQHHSAAAVTQLVHRLIVMRVEDLESA